MQTAAATFTDLNRFTGPALFPKHFDAAGDFSSDPKHSFLLRHLWGLQIERGRHSESMRLTMWGQTFFPRQNFRRICAYRAVKIRRNHMSSAFVEMGDAKHLHHLLVRAVNLHT